MRAIMWVAMRGCSTHCTYLDFDAAMKSRCHLALQYDAPTSSSRESIWKSQLEALPEDEIDIDITKCLPTLTGYHMNGREISNSINTARTLARHDGAKLQAKHLEIVIEVWENFNISLEKLARRRRVSPRQDSMIGGSAHANEKGD